MNRFRSPKDLALEYRRPLQEHPALVGLPVHCGSVQVHYPLVCNALGVVWPPPYKDFARELAEVMPRRRKEFWQRGKRVGTGTWYLVPDPAAAVIELAAVERKRA